MKLPRWSEIRGPLGHVITHPLLWAAFFVLWAGITLALPSDQFGKMAAFTTGLCITSAAYNLLVHQMLRHQRWLRGQLSAAHEMLQTMMTIKGDEIGRSIVDHVNGAIDIDLHGLGRQPTTKH